MEKAMATARIYMLYCVRQASGTDFGAIQALSGLAPSIPASGFGAQVSEILGQLPEVIAAIDTARSDPDNLFITTESSGDLEYAVWPSGDPVDAQAGQTLVVMLDLTFTYALNISLWDYDSASDNDLLGSVAIFEEEAGTGQIAKLAKSDIEGSAYYVVYEVFA
jgi:hypothetical protein